MRFSINTSPNKKFHVARSSALHFFIHFNAAETKAEL